MSQLQEMAKDLEQSVGAVTGVPLPQSLNLSPMILDMEGAPWWCKATLTMAEDALLRAWDRMRAPSFHLTTSLHMEQVYWCRLVCAWDLNQVLLKDVNRSG